MTNANQPRLQTFDACSGNKTYATAEAAQQAVVKHFAKSENEAHRQLTYFVTTVTEGKYAGRFIPVFVGERALQAGVHFRFHVIG